MEQYLQTLNKEQLEAVLHTKGPLLVLAGAGSGKTKMLVAKVIYLLKEKQVPMSQILMLTFTNRAANEMKKRVEDELEYPTDELFAGTFHSFCMRVLKRNSHLLKMKSDFTVIAPDEVQDILSLLRAEIYPDKDDSFPTARNLRDMFSACINRNISLDVAAEDINPGFLRHIEILETIQERYRAYKLSRGYMDYDDMLVHTVALLQENEDLRALLDTRFQYILADEYQDTNYLQDKLLELLTKNTKNLTVVGDDNQSIYKFRGAAIKNILTFTKRHEGCHKVILHENYRSSQEILDLANEVMTCASEGIPKKLHGQFNTDKKPEFHCFTEEVDESVFVLSEIKKRLNQGQKPEEISVIIRSARHSLLLESMLVKDGIAYNKYGGLRLFDKKVIKDIFAYLQVVQDNHSELAWYRLLQLYPNIGAKVARAISEDMFHNGCDCLPRYVKKKYYHVLEHIVATIRELQHKSIKEQIHSLIHGEYKTTVEYAIENRTYRDSSKARAKKLEEFTKFRQELKEAEVLEEIAEGYASAKDFVSDFILDSVERKEEENAITITTIHSAKGLEFESVFLMHCGETQYYRNGFGKPEHVFVTEKGFWDEEGMKPERAMLTNKDDSEELRCFYVAVTRAKKELVMSYSMTYNFKSENPLHYLWLTDAEKHMTFRCHATGNGGIHQNNRRRYF